MIVSGNIVRASQIWLINKGYDYVIGSLHRFLIWQWLIQQTVRERENYSRFDRTNSGNGILYTLLTFTIIGMRMENQMFCTQMCKGWCVCAWMLVAVGNQFFRITNREKKPESERERERRVKSRLFLFFMCTSLVVVVPSTPSQGSDESSKIFPVTSLSPLFFLFSPSLRDIRDVCVCVY